tara:strand:- start:19821 stop:20609 length:789 start_codon:yes stop_codon:yes gene_type:complete
MTPEQYRRQYLRWRRIYERKGVSIFGNAIKQNLKRIPLDDLNDNNYEVLIKSSFNDNITFKAYEAFYTEVGRTHARRLDNEVKREEKAFESEFIRGVLEFLLNFAGQRIISVNETLAEFIINEIQKRADSGKSISQIVTEIIKQRQFYRPQLLRIVRTETTSAAGYAADSVSSNTGLILDKMWISATDSRTRRIPEDQFDHYKMHLVKVPDGEPFEVKNKKGGVELMRFPGDPKGSAGDVINCRCTLVKVPRRDSDGNLVRR